MATCNITDLNDSSFELTLKIPGTIQSQIPIVSGSMWCPRGNTCGWSNPSLRIYDFPFLYGPAIDTTHTGPRRYNVYDKISDSAFKQSVRVVLLTAVP